VVDGVVAGGGDSRVVGRRAGASGRGLGGGGGSGKVDGDGVDSAADRLFQTRADLIGIRGGEQAAE